MERSIGKMKKYLVIGNPIEHSLSPKLHNYWIKKNNIDAGYEKKLIQKGGIEEMVHEIKGDKINGINVTVPFKKLVIPFLDQLTSRAIMTQSVNTISKEGDAIIGDNTDIGGFGLSLKHINYNLENKKIFILGAGGVTSSIIMALPAASKIYLSNRTREKAENLKKMKLHTNIEIIEWDQISKNIPDFDMIINTTSLGLKDNDKIKLDYNKIGTNKLFYDVIYNPSKTNFLTKGEALGNQIENGKMMFIYQAQLAFDLWHGILPEIDKEIIKILDV